MKDQEMLPEAAKLDSQRCVSGIERVTAVVLIAVVAALGWLTAAAVVPQLGQTHPAPWQVIAILALLVASLVLVSLVALLHTRR